MVRLLRCVQAFVVIAIVCSLVAIFAATAQANVESAAVTAEPTETSSPASYTVEFQVGARGALSAGVDTITTVFPAGTTLPSGIGKTHVSINGIEPQVDPTVSGQAITLVTPVNVANGGLVSISIAQAANIVNPKIATSNCSIRIYTSREPIPVSSNAYTITPYFSICPIAGPRNGPVTVTGNGWAPNQSIEIRGALNGNGTASVDGTFSLSASPTNSGIVTCIDGSGWGSPNSGAGNIWNISEPTFKLTPMVQVTPTSGNRGTCLTIRGYDFTSGSSIPVNGITVAGVACGPSKGITLQTLDPYGILDDFVTTLTAPSNTTCGVSVVSGTDANGETGTTTFTVEPLSLTISPPSGPTGTVVTIVGSSFAAGDTIAPGGITIGGAAWNTQEIQVDSYGNWTASLIVPATAPVGDSAVAVTTKAGSILMIPFIVSTIEGDQPPTATPTVIPGLTPAVTLGAAATPTPNPSPTIEVTTTPNPTSASALIGAPILTLSPILTQTLTPFGPWSDSFESYGTEVFPSSGGWALLYDGLGSSYQYVDNSHTVSGTKSLHLVGSSCWSAEAYHAVDMPLQVSFEAMVFIDPIVNCGCTNTIALIGLYDPNIGTWGTHYGFVWFGCDGKIYAGPSSYNRQYDVALGSYQPRQWYHIQIHTDLVSRLFDVYINGTLRGSGLQVMDGGNPKGIDVASGHGANPTVWFDDVKVWAAEPAPPEESTLTGVGTGSQISKDPKVIFPNMGLAIATVLVFYLAATVFNSTIRENYDVIEGWRSRGSTRLRFLSTSYRKVVGGLRRVIGSKWMFYAELIFVVVLCAGIYLKLEPYFINSLRGRALFTALALGILVATFAYEGTQVLVSGRRFGVPAAIRIYPIAILIALIFLLISLKISFHPGLIYGFVGAYAALSIPKSKILNTKQRAITIALGVLAILSVCVAAFVLREFVINHWGGESFARMLVEDILVAAIAIGLEGLLFSIALPFTFSDGKKILDWNFWVWYVCAGLVVFAFWELIINHDKRLPEAVKSMNVHMMFGLMGIPLVISGLIYLFFWLRKKRLRRARIAEQPSSVAIGSVERDKPSLIE